MPETNNPQGDGEKSVLKTVEKISQLATSLEREGKNLRTKHELFTVSTILLGVSAPAVVTFIATHSDYVWIAIIVTAIATASATIRSVLRYNERYSNSALTSLALSHLEKQTQARQYEIRRLQPQYHEEEFFKLAAWADEEMYKIKKAFVEKDVTAITQETIKLTKPPEIEAARFDNTSHK